MSQLLSVRGGRRLEGEVTIQGAKNSVLPILAATLLARGQVALLGCPRLRDVDASIRILRHLGCDAHWEADALAVDTTALRRCEISDVLMREMRSSAIFLGAIPGPVRAGGPELPRRVRAGPPAYRPPPCGPAGPGGGDPGGGRLPPLPGGPAAGPGSGAADAIRGGHGESDAGRLRGGGRHGDLQRRPGAGGGGPAELPERLRGPGVRGGELRRVHRGRAGPPRLYVPGHAGSDRGGYLPLRGGLCRRGHLSPGRRRGTCPQSPPPCGRRAARSRQTAEASGLCAGSGCGPWGRCRRRPTPAFQRTRRRC